MSVTLLQGDCLDLMHAIPDGSIDMVLADLPYGTTACKWDTVIPLEPWWAHYKRVIKRNGAIVLFGAQPFTSALVMSNPKWFAYQWVWVKNLKVDHLNARRRPMKGHEDIMVFYAEQPTYNPQMIRRTTQQKAGNRFNGSTTVYGSIRPQLIDRQSDWLMPDTTLYFDAVHSSQGRQHPTQKPVALMEYLIRTYTNEGETVLDNTMGSGTTGVACVNTNRAFIGIERDPQYFTIAQERIQKAQEQARQLTLEGVA
jgi:DNA modification methylase